MSFIGKAVKKVFDIGKKIVKAVGRAFENKWFRTAFLVGLSVFTVGLGAAGFAGFNAAMAASGASTSVGAFFSAVGTTMATGFSAITASVSSLFGGTTAATGAIAPVGSTITTGLTTVAAPLSSAVAAGGSGTALLNAGLGVTASALPASALGAGVTNAATAASTGFLAGAKSLASRALGTLASPTMGGTFMRSAVLGGIANYQKQKELDYDRRVAKRLNFYGGVARGGSADVPEGLIRSPFPQSTPESSTARKLAVNPSPRTNRFMSQAGRTGSPLLSKSTSIAGLGPEPQAAVGG